MQYEQTISLAVVGMSVVCGGCDRTKQNESSPGGDAAMVVSNAQPAAPETPKAIKLVPNATFASNYIDNDHGKADLPLLAFDGDPQTAWQCTKKKTGPSEWLDIYLEDGTALERIVMDAGFDKNSEKHGDLFPLNAHVKHVSIQVDGAQIAEASARSDERRITFAVGKTVSRFRIVFDELYPGTKWQNDVAIPEIELWGIPSKLTQDRPSAYLSPYYEKLFVRDAKWTYKGTRTEPDVDSSEDGMPGSRKLPTTIKCTVDDTASVPQGMLSHVSCTNSMSTFPASGFFLANAKGLYQVPGIKGKLAMDETLAKKLQKQVPVLEAQPKTMKSESASVMESLSRKVVRIAKREYDAWCYYGSTRGEGDSTGFCLADGLPMTSISIDESPNGAASQVSVSVELVDG